MADATVYVLHGAWGYMSHEGCEIKHVNKAAVLGTALDPEPLLKKLNEIADTRAGSYVEFHWNMDEKRDETSYEAEDAGGEYAKFYISECALVIPENVTDVSHKRNTKISYLYRDGCNYKQHNEVTVRGHFTKKQIDAILDCLDAGEYFIPSQVGFPEIRFGSITEDDHCWFELDKYCFEETYADADIDMSPGEVVAKFMEAKDNWDDSMDL